MFDGRWRKGVERGIEPVGVALRRTGLRADHLTATGVVMAGATAVAIGSGRLFLGLVLLGASALPDLLDGAVAKASGSASDRGAFFDSVADRVSDALLLGGAAWYLAGEGSHLPVLAFAVGACSMLISYERAKAESIGISARGGLMERAERFVLLSIGLAFGILVPVLWAMLVLTAFTAADRFRRVYRQADRPQRRHTRPRRAERPAREPRPALREWWAARRVDGGTERTRPRHRSVRRSQRP